MIPLQDARVAKITSPKVADGDTVAARAQAVSDAFVAAGRNLGVLLSPGQVSFEVGDGEELLLTQWDLDVQPVTGDGSNPANLVSNEIRDGVFTLLADFWVIDASFLLSFQDLTNGTTVWTLEIKAGFNLGEIGEFVIGSFRATIDSTVQADVFTAIIAELRNLGPQQNPPVEMAAFLSHSTAGIREALQVHGYGKLVPGGPPVT